MSDTGWVSPGTVVNDSSVGTDAWSNPTNARASDNTYAITKRDGYGFSYEEAIKIVKSNGTIGSSNKSTGARLPLTEQYISYGGSSDLWGETWSYTDINDSDFGVVFQVENRNFADITYSNYLKATNFGFNIPSGATIEGLEVQIEQWLNDHYDSHNNTAEVDHIRIKVYYTESGTPTVGVKYPLPAFKR